ncbi:MAG TPA: ParB/RepB/Spo0J family partition protein [Nocardioides sp.]|uniref:ParB/RepB/Spo0J family partition protein n=1 Tax=Nocardioides sp. TaxID=35761 RepID=UPI002C0E89C5|nr:ParB/RepB/Spo0J family partition protein [Nocardioides sp.]HTW16175.1 ParB/RepB/Spo0J family partition protein [Nocardioides sp.]
MAKFQDYRAIPLDDLEIGQGQVRVSETGVGIDELADSIAAVGLLEPIVVAPTDVDGRYEILTGQRRFLAHVKLQETGRLDPPEIMCAVLSEKVDEAEAKAISLTENLMRRPLTLRDTIQACVYLYKLYDSIKEVSAQTGISQSTLREYIKYPRLMPELRDLVDHDKVKLKVALRAQDIAASKTDSGDPQSDVAVELAKEMSGMSGAQQDKLAAQAKAEPDAPVEELIEEAKGPGKIVQIVVTLTSAQHARIQSYAQEQGAKQDDAAAQLIEVALNNAGF